MRIIYKPLVDLEVALVGWRLDGKAVHVEAKIGKRDAALILSAEEARNLKRALEDGLFQLASKGHG